MLWLTFLQGLAAAAPVIEYVPVPQSELSKCEDEVNYLKSHMMDMFQHEVNVNEDLLICTNKLETCKNEKEKFKNDSLVNTDKFEVCEREKEKMENDNMYDIYHCKNEKEKIKIDSADEMKLKNRLLVRQGEERDRFQHLYETKKKEADMHYSALTEKRQEVKRLTHHLNLVDSGVRTLLSQIDMVKFTPKEGFMLPEFLEELKQTLKMYDKN